MQPATYDSLPKSFPMVWHWAPAGAGNSWLCLTIYDGHFYDGRGVADLGAVASHISVPFQQTTVSLPDVAALVYWTIVVPHDVVDGYLFNNGDLQSFCILNLYFISLVVALIEVFFLSSINTPGPFFVHVLWLSAIGVGYYFWAFFGHILMGNYIYFFLDPEKVGEENVVIGLIAFVSLLNIFYGVAYGMSSDAITCPLKFFGALQLPK
ncbi:hypothetical protein V493_04900 [Pseudogymnoascus sp. VKM F-4281 (FW-2241)]|nr:hypothetical protein V493_04900 [Pseudogymnoascus sp. VKM F-4281 (FW-2241)]